MSSFRCVRRTAVEMPMLRGSMLTGLQRTPSCSLDDQYVQYSANAVYNVEYGHLKSLDWRGPGLGIQVLGLAIDN